MSSVVSSLPRPAPRPDPDDPSAGPAAPFADWLRRHARPAEPGVWDELRGGAAGLRPSWQRFAELLPPPADGADPAQDLQRRAAELTQQIARDGVTHNVFGPDGPATRPWSLELLPLILEAADWAVLEAGVAQRAALLEAVLADVYGPQRLFHDGLLPAALVMRHPGYLRPLLGSAPAGGRRLHIVAFDVARGVDGRWWVAGQHTQGPSGLGYVLHNRLRVARQFPEAFRELRVQHIAASCRRLLDSLEAAAREVAGGQTPRLVLLTPGPFSETYYEHAYLARDLGLPLVEGGDLTVRGERLYLKTVEGLQPVHGVLRRLDDDFCDPLELRPDSALGVPGLLQAARAGSVVIANALGSAFLESPAVGGFLPAIAERLLGEPLRLPAIPSWWCGERAAWDDVKGRLEGKLLRTSFPSGGRLSQIVDAAQVDVDNDPDAWTVQARLRFSRAPIFGAGAVTPRPALVRVYAMSDLDGRWHVLPGGMTRVAQHEDASVSMQRGGSSLDTWVRTDGVVDTFSMLRPRLSIDDLVGRETVVASRTGENLFWLGRYTERTEQQLRLARAVLEAPDDDTESGAAVRAALSRLAVATGLAPWGVPTLEQAAPVFERAVLQALGDERSFSIAFNLQALARVAQGLRERLSPQQWGLIRALPDALAAATAPAGRAPDAARVLQALDPLALQLAALTGLQNDRMTRDHGWRLLAVGRLLERLHGMALTLQTGLEASAHGSAAGRDLLLELFDSTITFRARYQRHEDLLALADLLVFDDANPRAFAGVLRRLRSELAKLPGDDATIVALRAELPSRGCGLALASLRGLDDAQVAASLQALAARLAAASLRLADRITARYFTLERGTEQRV